MKIKQWEHSDKIGGNISVGHYRLNNFFYEDGDFTWSQYKWNKDQTNGMPSHEWMAMQRAIELRDLLGNFINE